MRNLLFALLAILCVFSTSEIASAEDIPEQLQNEILPATVKIFEHHIQNTASPVSAGSGTIVFNSDVVTENGVLRRIIVMTAAHVVKPRYAGVYNPDTGTTELVPMTTVSLATFTRDTTGEVRSENHFLPERDLQVKRYEVKTYEEVDAAFLIIDVTRGESWAKNIRPVRIASTTKASRTRIGSDLLIAGCPLVMDPVIFRNRLIQRNVSYVNFIETDFIGHLVSRVLTGGNSGGGVYNGEGELIGIVTLRIGSDFGAFTGIEHILPETLGDSPVLKVFQRALGMYEKKSNSS